MENWEKENPAPASCPQEGEAELRKLQNKIAVV